MKQLRCKISSVDAYSINTRRVLLAVPDTARPDFKAGQYLNVVIGDKRCPFSIANAPDIQQTLELHIRPTPGSTDSVAIEKLLESGEYLDIELPLGDCYLESPPGQPLILMAASTGITQMKSIVEFLIPRDSKYPVRLYWGVINAADLYLMDLCNSWSQQLADFRFIPVVSEPENSPDWQGRTGLLLDAVLEDFNDLRDVTVYVSGGPGMVYATLDRFVAHGMQADQLHSDVFSFAPRNTG